MSQEEEQGVQIAATPISEAHREAEEEGLSPNTNSFSNSNSNDQPSLGIGDRIQIESKSLGRVIGKIYYLDEELLRILPDGVSNRLYDFPITAEGIDPALGVSEILTEPSAIPSFIEQNRLRVGSKVDTFTEEGDTRGSYTINAIDLDADTAILVADGDGTQIQVEFNFTGIPRDLPFAVLRVAPEQEVVTSEDNNDSDDEDNNEAETDDQDEGEGEVLGEIEIPVLAEVSEIPSAERVYPEVVQKNDFLVDLLTMLDAPSKKNKNILKQIRSFVEIANGQVRDLVEYAADGSPIGIKPASVSHLLDLLQTGKVPLARPVLEAIRVLYLDHSLTFVKANQMDTMFTGRSTEDSFKNDDFEVNYLSDSVRAALNAQTQVSSVSDNDIDRPRFYTELNDLVQLLQRPWRSADTSFTPKIDTDFFRRQAPTDDKEVPGLEATFGNSKDPMEYFPEVLDSKVRFSIQRALASTLRKSKTGKYVIALPADKAGLISYLLFPIAVANVLGSNRTCILSRDIGRSLMTPKPISQVLDEVGTVSEIPSASTILNVGKEGNTFGNIGVADYLSEVLKQVQTQFLGLNDFRTMLIDLGLDGFELNTETTEILQKRVLEDIARVRSLIKNLRETLASSEEQEVASFVKPFLDETSAEQFKERLATEPILSDQLKEMSTKTPTLAQIDLAMIAYLLSTKQDLTIATLGGVPQLADKERLRSQADAYLYTVKNILAAKQRRESAGHPPIPNKCVHVSTLISIRKIRDDDERIALLAKFVGRFQGERSQNYVNCLVCNEHLLCIHEILQIQQALRPREQEVLQKELYLNMAGGAFNGHYICRNCGQPMSELQFDNHIEYNDNGVPINGRELVVDEDEVAEEQQNLKLGVGVPGTEDIKFDNEAKTLCYDIAKELYQRVGIYPDFSDFKNVVEASFLRIQTLDSREDYNKKAAAAAKKGAKNIPDYDTYIKGYTVGAVASIILLDIQTHIPDYVIRYTLPGCEAGFGGFPLQGVEKKTGVNYMACAVGSVTKNEEPWNRTGFLKIRSDETRRATIAKFMEGIINKIIDTEPAIQQKMAAKLEYLRETFGAEAAEGRPRDKVPVGFLPVQEIVKAEGEEPTVVPEANSRGDAVGMRKLAAVWIREAHKHALRTAQLVRGNPFAETACCFNPIEKPGSYWEHSKIGLSLGGRQKPISPLFRSSIVFPHFKPKQIIELAVEAPLNLAFRIFLKVCYTGPRMGYAHELGYNGVCDNCGLKLSSKYLYPDYSLQTSKKSSAPIINTQELISDLEAQGVNVTPEFFQELLDTSHKNYIVPSQPLVEVPPTSQLLSRMGNIDPAPVTEWRPLLSDLITKLTALPKDANETDIAIAYGSLSEVASEAEQFVRRRLPAANAILDKWLASETKLLAEIVIAYLITPLQRLVSKYETKALVVSNQYDLGYQHMMDLNGVLERHVDAVSRYSSSFNSGIALVKIKYFLNQIRGFIDIAQEIQVSRVPGGSIGVKYLKRALLLGPLAELLDFNRVPVTSEGDVAAVSLVDKSGSALVAFLTACMGKFQEESLSYSPDDIRLRIAKAKEREKMNIISDLDEMDDDRKRVELVNKALGLGRWAIGGTKLIYAYDADQYEKERAERIRRGDTDYPVGETNVAPNNNIVFDISGMPGQPDFYEGEGGYDVGQEADDDF
jgi:hypothetical protein